MYRFLTSPKWLLGHVLALVVLLLFPLLGFWQLRRLGEVRAQNAMITARMDQPPRPLGDVLDAHGPDDLDFRWVEARGTYRSGDEVLLTGTVNQGRPGHDLLTPLATADGIVLVVDRGWVPYSLNDPPVTGAEPPAGMVTVRGVLLPGQRAPQRPDGPAERLTAVDLDLLGPQLGDRVAPAWLLLQEQVPNNPGALPLPGSPPDVDEGSHLAYAVQWFLFTAIVAVGYPILVVRTAREQ